MRGNIADKAKAAGNPTSAIEKNLAGSRRAIDAEIASP